MCLRRHNAANFTAGGSPNQIAGESETTKHLSPIGLKMLLLIHNTFPLTGITTPRLEEPIAVVVVRMESMKIKSRFVVLALIISMLPELAAAESVIYACTRRANGGVTQTYIAPMKNGVPVCNNRKHQGPFPLLDTNQIGAAGPAGPAGPAGADGKDGKDGAAGAQGAQGPGGAVVSGKIRVCGTQLFSEQFVLFQSSRQAFCVLEGTSFTYRHLFEESELGETGVEQAFSLFHVPDGTYTLSCDIERACGYVGSYSRASVAVTVQNGAAVNAGVIDLCDFVCDIPS